MFLKTFTKSPGSNYLPCFWKPSQSLQVSIDLRWYFFCFISWRVYRSIMFVISMLPWSNDVIFQNTAWWVFDMPLISVAWSHKLSCWAFERCSCSIRCRVTFGRVPLQTIAKSVAFWIMTFLVLLNTSWCTKHFALSLTPSTTPFP